VQQKLTRCLRSYYNKRDAPAQPVTGLDDYQPKKVIPILEKYSLIQRRVASALEKSGRSPDDATLLVVSKTWPAEVVREVVDCGHSIFGESRVQEALEKIPLLPGNLTWHFIGNLQKNKIRKILPLCPVLHSIGSLELARQVNRISAEEGQFPKVYLEVNMADESSKHGFSETGLESTIGSLLAFDRLQIEGLMAVPPFDPDPERTRPYFTRLRRLRDSLETRTGIPLPGLSMGMSHDFEVALEEGSTIVRVGSAIFGNRSYPKTETGIVK